MTKARWSDTQEKVPDCIQEYFSCRDELSVQDGLVFKGERLVTPPNKREEFQQKLHQSHHGIQSCVKRGREIVYWPRMRKDIDDSISSCAVYKSYQPDQHERADYKP